MSVAHPSRPACRGPGSHDPVPAPPRPPPSLRLHHSASTSLRLHTTPPPSLRLHITPPPSPRPQSPIPNAPHTVASTMLVLLGWQDCGVYRQGRGGSAPLLRAAGRAGR